MFETLVIGRDGSKFSSFENKRIDRVVEIDFFFRKIDCNVTLHFLPVTKFYSARIIENCQYNLRTD
jgi:hypothetical protein